MHKYGGKPPSVVECQREFREWTNQPKLKGTMVESLEESIRKKFELKYNDKTSSSYSGGLIYDYKTLSEACVNEFQKQTRENDRKKQAKLDQMKAETNKEKKKALKEELLVMDENFTLQLDPARYSNEIFFSHPNSIVAMQFNPNNAKGAKYMGITSAWFEDKDNSNNRFPIIVPLQDKWVKDNFDHEFLKLLEDYSSSMILFKEGEQNITSEAASSSEKVTGNHFYNFNWSGDTTTGLMKIVRLKVECEYKGISTDPSKATWYIKSVEQNTFFRLFEKSRDRLEEKYSDWLEIEYDLVADEKCVGISITDNLLAQAGLRRKQFLSSMGISSQSFLQSRKMAPTIPDWAFTTEEHYFNDDGTDMDKVPVYRADQQQICGLQWKPGTNDDGGQFYGKALLCVKRDGIRNYISNIRLKKEWVEDNFTEAFISQVKTRGEQHASRYLWVPCGSAKKREFPWPYNTTFPKIKYQQGKRDTCVSSSLASCMHYLGHVDLAQWIEDFGVKFVSNKQNNVDRFLSSLMDQMERDQKGFSRKFMVVKLKANLFDLFSTDLDTRKYPKVLQLLGSNGGMQHAITVYDGLIFDSNLQRAVELTVDHLEFCIDAKYIGILHGYQLVPRNKVYCARKKMKKKQRHEL